MIIRQTGAQAELCFCSFLHIWATSWENQFMPYANNKDADQPARICAVWSVPLLFAAEISVIPLVSVQAGLSLPSRKLRRQVFWWRGSYGINGFQYLNVNLKFKLVSSTNNKPRKLPFLQWVGEGSLSWGADPFCHHNPCIYHKSRHIYYNHPFPYHHKHPCN